MALTIKIYLKLFMLVTVFISAACSGETTKRQTYVFECEGGVSFVTNIQGTSAWVFLPEATIELKQQSSGVFSEGHYQLVLQENGAEWRNKNQPASLCRNNRKLAIWEGAKLAGVDYRAVGNEPGWVVEIAGNQVTYKGDYGQTIWVFTSPEPRVDQQQRETVYSLNNQQQQLELTILGKPCMDSMSGDRYETTVNIKLPTKSLRGCGKALH